MWNLALILFSQTLLVIFGGYMSFKLKKLHVCRNDKNYFIWQLVLSKCCNTEYHHWHILPTEITTYLYHTQISLIIAVGQFISLPSCINCCNACHFCSRFVEVLEKSENGWWRGTIDDRTGWFPANFVRPISGMKCTCSQI